MNGGYPIPDSAGIGYRETPRLPFGRERPGPRGESGFGQVAMRLVIPLRARPSAKATRCPGIGAARLEWQVPANAHWQVGGPGHWQWASDTHRPGAWSPFP